MVYDAQGSDPGRAGEPRVIIVQDPELERGEFLLYDHESNPFFRGKYEEWEQIDGGVYDKARMLAVNPDDLPLVVDTLDAWPIQEVIH